MKKCPFCNEDVQLNAKKCRFCHEWLDSEYEIKEIKKSQVFQEFEKEIDFKKRDANKGIGGWLHLIGLGLFLTPIRILYELYTSFITQINDGTFISLADSASPLYLPQYASIFTFEFLGNIIFLFLSIYLFYLFVNERKLFPKFFIVYLIAYFLFALIDYYRVASEFANIPGMVNYSEIIRIVIYGVIWGGYILVSQRAKNTFVKTSIMTFDKGLKILIGICGVVIGVLFLSIKFSGLSSDRGNNVNQIDIPVSQNISLSNYHTLDLRSKAFIMLNDVQEINAEASVGFRSDNGNTILILPEEIDLETQLKYDSETYNSEILENLNNFFSDRMEYKITKQYIKDTNGYKYYVLEGLIRDGEYGVKVMIGVTSYNGAALNIYVYGFDQTVTDDFMKFIENIN